MPYGEMITGWVVFEQRRTGLYPIAVVSTKEKALERAAMPLAIVGLDGKDAPIRFAFPTHMFFPEGSFPVE